MNLIKNLLAKSGIAELARLTLTRSGRFALNLHGISSKRYANIPKDLQPHHSADEFRRVLSWLALRFNFLSVDEFLRTSKPGILVTFDDGHANNLTNALPILKEFNAQGLFFVSTQHVINPRDWLGFTRLEAKRGWGDESHVPEDFARDCFDGLSASHLAELAASPNAVIGAHTVTHPFLTQCAPDEVQREMEESKEYLEKLCKKPVDYFAYPYGNYNHTVAQAAQSVGFRTAFAVDTLHTGLPAYEIPRVGIYDSHPDYLNLKLSGLHRRPLREKILG
jgi:peptidoglycan/xylan/chitin deacetylase (PgdA/CDA1 family)